MERWATDALRARIRDRLHETGYTHRQVEHRSAGRVSKGTVATLLNGKTRRIRRSTLQGFADALDLDYQELLDLTGVADDP